MDSIQNTNKYNFSYAEHEDQMQVIDYGQSKTSVNCCESNDLPE
jgi:hypothetical protein